MADNRIVVLSGPPGSGKAKVGEILGSRGWEVISLGDVVRDEVKSRGLEPTSTNMSLAAKELREEFGPSAIMERVLPKIDAVSENNHTVIDGICQIEELERLQSSQPRIVVIAIDASEEIRRKRVTNRARSDDSHFEDREEREWGWGLEIVMQLADITIENNGTEGDFVIKINKALQSIGVI